MALQEDPSKYFGSVDYFRNKDEQRRTVNDMRREERNKRIMQQGLTRNIKKAIREGKDPRGFIGAARDLGLSAAGGGGIGQEASQRDAELRARAASLFEGVQSQKDKAEKTVGGVPTPSGGMVSPTPTTNQAATQKPQSAVTAPQKGATSTSPFTFAPVPFGKESYVANQTTNVVAPTKPSWADEVKNDRTFKNVDLMNPRFAGKTREEARQMVMSQKAQNAMRGFNQAGEQLVMDEKQTALDLKNSAIVDAIDRDQATQKRIEQTMLQGGFYEDVSKFNGSPQQFQSIADRDLRWNNDIASIKMGAELALQSKAERKAQRDQFDSPQEWMKSQAEREIARDTFYANEYQKNYADALKRVRSERYANEQFEIGRKENEMQRVVDTQINKTLNPYS